MNRFYANVAGAFLAAFLIGVQTCFGLSVSSYTTDADGITCTCNTGIMKVKICQADIVRVAYSPTSTIPTRPLQVVTNVWPTPTFTKTEAGDTITLTTSKIKVKVSKTTANVTYTDLNDGVILAEAAKSMAPTTVSNTATNTVTTSYYSPSTEALYGLGQHMEAAGTAVTVNYKGHGQTLMDEMYGNPTFYTAVDVLVSTRGYGLFWDNYSKSWFYGNDANNTQFRFVSECGNVLDYYFFYGPKLDTVISKYRTATGKAPMFPKWAYGLIQSKDHYVSQADYLSVKTGYRNNNIPLDCIVQDWQYWAPTYVQGCYCFTSGYGDVKSTITQMHAANLHTMLSVWAEVDQGSAIYTALSAKGELWPTDNNCTTHFIDAYSSDARTTFWTDIKNALFDPSVEGWDAWWLDNDEPFAYPCGFDRHSLTTALGNGCLFYNSYTFPLSQMGYTNWRKDIPGKRFVMLHRANFAGQQAHATMQWNSDIPCSFGTLANCVPSGLNATISGTPYWTTDIGGYWGSNGVDWSTAANNELFTRWLQYGSFCPVFRIHGNGAGKELYESEWSATTKANLLMIDKLHYRLMPYIYSLAWMTTNNDYTPMRHLIMDFTNDANVTGIGTQYMYGPAIMVSPVTTQGQTSRSVYLPAGTWYDFWTGASVTGGTSITANAPLSQIPLHIRAGSILPMGPEIQYATQRSDTIELRVYPGANGSFTIYEDEGDNYNYETGAYATIPITYIDNPRNVIVGARSGSFTGMDAKKVFNIVYVLSNHGTGEAQTATPDCQIVYTGSQESCNPVGTLPARVEPIGVLPAEFSTKSAMNSITLPYAFSGKAKTIMVYDCSGKLLQRAVVKKNILDLRKDFGLPSGVYIVKAAAIR